MVLKFPSGKVSVSIQDLRENQQSQSTCGVCDKPWFFKSHACIMSQLHVLHPCQHIVGSGCWSSVPDEHKDKCPVCKIEIRCEEKVRVHSAVDRFAPASQGSNGHDSPSEDSPSEDSDSQDSDAETFVLAEEMKDGQAQDIIVEAKMKEGLNNADVRAIMYYMNLRARLHKIKGSLSTLLASTKTLTPAHRERLVLFLTNTPQHIQDSRHRKIEVALSAFNISGGTNFTMNDLRKILSSAEEWIKGHFAAILEETHAANKDASAVRILEEHLATVEADLKELKDRLSRESAQRLKGEIQLAIEEIAKKTEKEAVKIRTKANEEISDIRVKATEEIRKLQSHGGVMKK